VCRGEEPTYVGMELEDRRAPVVALIAADPLEYTEAVVEGVGQEMDGPVFPVYELTV
jgi:hypothetical protein